MPAGTITLTNDSNIVEGSGTSFSAEFSSGDVLASTVGEVAYTLFIQSVDSDTQVTLVKNYDGPTATGLAWSAIPRNVAIAIPAQIATEVSKALRGLNQDKSNWQQVFSSSGTITVTLPDGSSFSGPSWQYLSGTLSDINTTLSGINTTLSEKASIGNNNDITSLSGLTTALSVNQGGTGATTAAGARTSLELKSAAVSDVLGTVSQSSGVPTGAIIETGSNASGWYVRFADGTQLCVGRVTTSTSSLTTWTYPASFSSVPVLTGMLNGALDYVFGGSVSETSTSAGIFSYVAPTGSRAGRAIGVIAIGRWF